MIGSDEPEGRMDLLFRMSTKSWKWLSLGHRSWGWQGVKEVTVVPSYRNNLTENSVHVYFWEREKKGCPGYEVDARVRGWARFRKKFPSRDLEHPLSRGQSIGAQRKVWESKALEKKAGPSNMVVHIRRHRDGPGDRVELWSLQRCNSKVCPAWTSTLCQAQCWVIYGRERQTERQC
jgi:hypothetical protein